MHGDILGVGGCVVLGATCTEVGAIEGCTSSLSRSRERGIPSRLELSRNAGFVSKDGAMRAIIVKISDKNHVEMTYPGGNGGGNVPIAAVSKIGTIADNSIGIGGEVTGTPGTISPPGVILFWMVVVRRCAKNSSECLLCRGTSVV